VACYKLNFESLRGSKSFIYIYIYNIDLFLKSSLRWFRGSMVCGGLSMCFKFIYFHVYKIFLYLFIIVIIIIFKKLFFILIY
jgi:hypothetical protein